MTPVTTKGIAMIAIAITTVVVMLVAMTAVATRRILATAKMAGDRRANAAQLDNLNIRLVAAYRQATRNVQSTTVDPWEILPE